MSVPVVDPTHVLADPSFPHGTGSGYSRGCRRYRYDCPATPSCGDAHARMSKAYEVRRLANLPGPHDRIPGEVALAVLDELYEQHQSYTVIGALLGISRERAAKLHAAERPRLILRSTHEKILAARNQTPPPDAARRYPIEDAKRLLSCLAAQGYTRLWISEQIGEWSWPVKQQWVEPGFWMRLHELVQRIGDEQATPEATGLTQRQIDRCLRAAARNDWHPFACYDDEGNLDGRLIPGHPWAEADAECGLLIAIAARLVRPGWDPEEEPYHAIVARFAETYGEKVYAEKVQRAAKSLGVGPKTAKREENAARVRSVLAEVDAGTLDVVRAVVDLHLASWGTSNALLPRDHPAIADLVEKDEEERATRAAAYRERQQALKKEQKRRKRAQKRGQQQAKGQAA
jgi:hypothetical protein